MNGSLTCSDHRNAFALQLEKRPCGSVISLCFLFGSSQDLYLWCFDYRRPWQSCKAEDCVSSSWISHFNLFSLIVPLQLQVMVCHILFISPLQFARIQWKQSLSVSSRGDRRREWCGDYRLHACILHVPSNLFKMADSSWQNWLWWTLMCTHTHTHTYI